MKRSWPNYSHWSDVPLDQIEFDSSEGEEYVFLSMLAGKTLVFKEDTYLDEEHRLLCHKKGERVQVEYIGPSNPMDSVGEPTGFIYFPEDGVTEGMSIDEIQTQFELEEVVECICLD